MTVGLLSAVDIVLEEKKLCAMQSESTIRRLHVPVLRPEDVIHHLGSPTHWQPGRSAKSVADLWFSANGLPPSVKSALDHDPAFKGATLVDAFFERPVDLGDGQRPSQTDLMAILRLDGRLGVLAVEAKVDEPFGPTVHEWLSEAKGDATARPARLERLRELRKQQCASSMNSAKSCSKENETHTLVR